MAEIQHPPTTTTTIPSAGPIAPPTPSSEPSKLPQPYRGTILRRLRAIIFRYLASILRRTDHTILRLSTLLSNPTTTDSLLCTTGYSLTFIHALLSRRLEQRLTSFAARIAEKATPVLLPGETLIATLPRPASTQLLAQTVASVKALEAVIGDYRIFVRLWGLMGVYTWARGTWHTALPVGKDGMVATQEKLLRSLAWASIASCVGFQFLENGAYLAGKGVLVNKSWSGKEGKVREAKWWIWSSRFWAVYVVLELMRLGTVHYYREPQSSFSISSDEKDKAVLADGEKEGKLLEEERQREDRVWWRDLASNLAYMPMTLHWSVEEEKGILSDWGVGILGAIAGGANLVDAWRNTS